VPQGPDGIDCTPVLPSWGRDVSVTNGRLHFTYSLFWQVQTGSLYATAKPRLSQFPEQAGLPVQVKRPGVKRAKLL
jgi:hypothetical protein